jgi:hypothetical protein
MYTYGKSQCLMGNQLFLRPFSIPMLVQRVVTTAKKTLQPAGLEMPPTRSQFTGSQSRIERHQVGPQAMYLTTAGTAETVIINE